MKIDPYYQQQKCRPNRVHRAERSSKPKGLQGRRVRWEMGLEYLPPLKPTRDSRERCKLPQWQRGTADPPFIAYFLSAFAKMCPVLSFVTVHCYTIPFFVIKRRSNSVQFQENFNCSWTLSAPSIFQGQLISSYSKK